MGIVSDGQNCYLGKGKVYVAEVLAGVRGGERYCGSCEALNLLPAIEKKEKKDFALPGAPTLDSAVSATSAELSATFAEWMRDTLAMAVLGEAAHETQAAGDVEAEAMNDVQPGLCYQLAHRKVSNLVGHKGVTALVAGTDYEIADATVGLVYIKGGAIAAGDDLTWDYDYGDDSTWKIPIAGSPSREFYVHFIGNPTRGKVVELEIWRMRFEPDGGLDLVGDDYGNVKLKGTVLADSVNHASDPFGILRQRA